LGRADDARDFVMHNEDVAEIEIELAPHPDGEAHVLKRVLDRRKGTDKGRGRGCSTFYVNGEKVSARHVQELVRDTYAIAIENLCTFLPQDKVGGFSALTPQELLIETEKVLDKDGRYIQTHLGLIEAQTTLQDGASDVDAIRSKLKKLQHENEQLERAKDLLEERSRAIHQLDLLQKKQLWLQFEALRERAVELKEQKNKLKDRAEAAQKEVEPLERQVEAAAQRVKTMDAKERALREKVQAAMKESERHEKKFQAHDDRIEEGTLELQAMDDRRAQAEERVRECQDKADSDKANYERLPAREQIARERDDAGAAKREANHQYGDAKRTVREIQGRLRDAEERAKAAQGAVARLSDASAQRRTAVCRKFRELDRINAWIESHRGQFRRPVVGPVAAEITPTTAEAAAFIEQHVPNHTLKAYCVETMEDRDLLYSEIRQKMGVPINILLLRKDGGGAGSGGFRKPRCYSTGKMRELQRYGIHGYLDELFSAPDAVMQAVVEASAIDRVLVGDSHTYDNISAVRDVLAAPEGGGSNGGGNNNHLKSFVICCSSSNGPGPSKLFKFQGTKSRYANQISLRQDDVLPSQFISPGVDPSELTAAEAQLARAHEEVDALRPRMTEAEAAMREKESILQECHAAMEVATTRLSSHVKMEQKLENSLRKLREAKAAAGTDDKDEKRTLAEAIMNRLRNAVGALDARSQQVSVLVRATADGLGVNANKTLWNTEQRLAEYVFDLVIGDL
jgi:structural maintenance of chromosomes protein 5